ncbi:MAG: hypothetical protein U0T36_03430 [Saprospiraceae bacterium]
MIGFLNYKINYGGDYGEFSTTISLGYIGSSEVHYPTLMAMT